MTKFSTIDTWQTKNGKFSKVKYQIWLILKLRANNEKNVIIVGLKLELIPLYIYFPTIVYLVIFLQDLFTATYPPMYAPMQGWYAAPPHGIGFSMQYNMQVVSTHNTTLLVGWSVFG